jgi:peptidoglycan/xylan/chitin deacetylase (PgdA/CDA1 family)
MSSARAVVRSVLTLPGVSAPFASFRRGCAVVFMLHRFRDAERGIEGHDPVQVRRGLEYLRRHRYELLPLAEVFERLAGDGRRLGRAVAFTLDDGYEDQATVGAELFAEYDCPVTTFVTTGFLDRRLWFWWDQIEFVFRRTHRRELGIQLGGETLRYSWTDAAARQQAQLAFTERCKQVPDREKHAGIRRLAAEAEVELPPHAPEPYAPMSWELLRKSEVRGMSFGPHTVTHPVLSRADDDEARRELTESWARLRAEAGQPVPVFCYPNGRWDDFGSREVATLRRLQLAGAVVGEAGYADVRSFRCDPDGPFRVRRFNFPEAVTDLIQIVSGLERFKQLLRRET